MKMEFKQVTEYKNGKASFKTILSTGELMTETFCKKKAHVVSGYYKDGKLQDETKYINGK